LIDLEKVDEEIMIDEVSDEALESAAEAAKDVVGAVSCAFAEAIIDVAEV